MGRIKNAANVSDFLSLLIVFSWAQIDSNDRSGFALWNQSADHLADSSEQSVYCGGAQPVSAGKTISYLCNVPDNDPSPHKQ